MRLKQDFERVMLPHLAASHNLAFWILRNRDDAEDAVQDAYLRAFAAWATFEDGNARAWILKIVRNCCHSFRTRTARDQRNVVHLKDVPPSEVHSGRRAVPIHTPPEAQVMAAARRNALYQAVMSLPREYREVIVLREYEDLAYRQIAEVVDIPIGTVMSRLSRARRRLRDLLTGDDVGGHESGL